MFLIMEKNSNSNSKEALAKADLEKTIKGNMVDCDAIFRGMTLGEWLREWTLWLHSEDPNFGGQKGEFLFTRGNISYVYDKETGLRKKSENFHNKARGADGVFRGEVIFDDTPIWVNILSSFYSVGEYYEAKNLDTLTDVRSICREEMYTSGPCWLTLEKKGIEGKIDLIDKICLIESPSFQLTVPEKSALREYFQVPINPGSYDTVTIANIAFFESLPPGEYRLDSVVSAQAITWVIPCMI